MLVDENTNSWNPVVDGGRGGATPQQPQRHRNVVCQEANVTSEDTSLSTSLSTTGLISALSSWYELVKIKLNTLTVI